MFPLTSIRSWALLDGEYLTQVLLFLRKALLQALQLPQALTSLVFHGAHMLDEIQLGLGRVVAENTVVVAAAFPLNATLMVLEVLQRAEQRNR